MGKNILDMERLLDTYGNDILKLCTLYLKDTHLAEDAVQDTLFKAYRKYDTFNGQASEKTWIMRIAINVCKNYLRTAWLKKVVTFERIDDRFLDLPQNNLPEKFLIPDRAGSRLLEQIVNLKPAYKEVILLYYYQRFKISEIAQILKTKESTVAVRLSRAREKLKEALAGKTKSGTSLERWSDHERA